MPLAFFPEGTVSLPSDDSQRSLQKIVELMRSGGGSGGGGLVGVVDPEGSVAASTGTTYLNTATNSFWVKETGGSGVTGWLNLIA